MMKTSEPPRIFESTDDIHGKTHFTAANACDTAN